LRFQAEKVEKVGKDAGPLLKNIILRVY